jgi:alanyl-tRNA synthetase
VYSSKEIRQTFIDFFIAKGHDFVPSSPVVPNDDPTLLFANAGMNQFKNIFLGAVEPKTPRAANSQKCIRAGGKHNDLEEVGTDGYHHTFFEMLGNWSFGDYYKKEAITWAWELLTGVWELPKEKLYATVHHSDNEAFELWKSQTDIEHSHISFHGDKDNFWEMGEVGPCGPCSEIHIDRGEGHCDKQHIANHVCDVNAGCARYIELWNLVFIQYKREESGDLTPLKNRFVDTGAGLERITQVLQNKYSNYETDLFSPIIDKIAELSHHPYDPLTCVSHRVIADHIRCLCFALADGGFPSNEGRGYVLRRILRRAARHGRLLGFTEPFLHLLVSTVINIMGHHFVELNGKEEYIRMVIKAEEERFNNTLDIGLEKFADICSRLDGSVISGKDAFLLYDTYGFPLDLTMILASEKSLSVDIAGFDIAMQAQRERARKASRFVTSSNADEWIEFSPSAPTQFTGYEHHRDECRIQRYHFDTEGTVHLQLDRTPFYAESGGQVSDTGIIGNSDFEVSILHVRKIDDIFIHSGKIVHGVIYDAVVIARIDTPNRLDTARNHTATHMLHKALKEVLGDHVQQKGSLVSPEYLRFDFTHVKGLSPAEITKIEDIVNVNILDNREVYTQVMPLDEARKSGAVALFGEKYTEDVRVVNVKDFSKELCGGTHVNATGELGVFKIISESSSAAGIRRIEAITGRQVHAWIANLQSRLTLIADKLHTPEKALETKIDSLLEHLRETEDTLKKQSVAKSGSLADDLIKQAQDMGAYKFLAARVDCENADALRQIGDTLKDKAPDTVAVLFAPIDGKVSILCTVGSALLPKMHAGKIVGAVAALLDGKGGGRPDSAMAGGRDISKIPEAITAVEAIIASI